MEYKSTIMVEVKRATTITSNYDDFNCPFGEDGMDKSEQWRRAYFELLSWRNTWAIPYRLDIFSRSDHTPFLDIVVPTEHADKLIEALEELGYGNIKRYDLDIGIVETPFDDDVEVYEFFME